MHENLIYEGNTIYELDPECVRAKEKQNQRKQGSVQRRGRGRNHLQDERMTGEEAGKQKAAENGKKIRRKAIR